MAASTLVEHLADKDTRSVKEFECVKWSIVPKRIKCFCAGFMRIAEQEWMSKEQAENPYYRIPSYIQHICVTFYFDWMRLDIFTTQCLNAKVVRNDGTVFGIKADESMPSDQSSQTVNAANSAPHSEGVYEFKLRINTMKQGANFGFGVTSELDNIRGNKWAYEYNQGWTVYAAIANTGLFPWYARSINHGEEAFKSYSKPLPEGAIITMRLDCTHWRLSYQVNGTHVGEVAIQPNTAYHPFLSSSYANTGHLELELINQEGTQ